MSDINLSRYSERSCCNASFNLFTSLLRVVILSFFNRNVSKRCFQVKVAYVHIP